MLTDLVNYCPGRERLDARKSLWWYISPDSKIKALNNQCGGRDIKYHQHGYFNIMTRQNRILIIPTVGVRIGNSFKENCSAFYSK